MYTSLDIEQRCLIHLIATIPTIKAITVNNTRMHFFTRFPPFVRDEAR